MADGEIPNWLTALGKRKLPDQIDLDGRAYRLGGVFKNDFFAVTAWYASEAGKILLKIQRQAPLMFIPLGWLGRTLAVRELRALRLLHDVDGVPELLCPWGRTGLIREFVEGHPLQKGEAVADEFHAQLQFLVAAIHKRGMAYVDLEKCENVLVGDDGRPYLFDFQISWHLPRRLGGELWPATALRRWLQRGDRYHLLKLQRRTRPDQLSGAELDRSRSKPWFIRWHGRLVRPLTLCRRWALRRIAPERGEGERGRVTTDEAMGAT